GELTIRVLARRGLTEDRARGVADGWGGDRLRALVRGDELLLVWVTAWDGPPDAIEFFEAMPDVMPAARVERRGERVLVLIGRQVLPGGTAVWRGRAAAAGSSSARTRTRCGARRTEPSSPIGCGPLPRTSGASGGPGSSPSCT